MSSVGDALRRERLRLNVDFEQISRELKIPRRFLEAIEEERFDRLPAPVFAKNFVRQYAAWLGLDADEFAADVNQSLEPSQMPAPPPLIRVERVEGWQAIGDRRQFAWSSSLPALAMVVLVMLVCSGVYALWQHGRRPEPVSTPPPLVEAPAPQQAPVVQTATTTPPVQAAAPVSSGSADRHAETNPPTAPAANASAPANGPVKLQLTAAEPVWISARADGKYVFSGTLQANDTRTVEAASLLTLRVGNAGGLAVTLNGKPVGSLGARGQVKSVQFTSGGFKIVAPTPDPDDDNPL